jgi:YD repeat-containing protein
MTARISRVTLVSILAAALTSAASAQTITYTYDPLGRVTGESYSTGPSTTYGYDAADNRLRLTMSTGPNAPGAVNDSASTWNNTATTVSVLANDVSPLSYALTVTSASSAIHGTTAVNSGTTVTYTPATGYVGPDAFTYAISDGHGGTASATVTMAVNSSAPIANNDTAKASGDSVSVAVLANDSSPLSYSLTVTSVTTPTNGATATIVGGTTVTVGNMLAAGSTTFNYSISDGHGGTATATVTVHCKTC